MTQPALDSDVAGLPGRGARGGLARGLRGRPLRRRVRGARGLRRDQRPDALRLVRERGLAMAEAAAEHARRDGRGDRPRRRRGRAPVREIDGRLAGQLQLPGPAGGVRHRGGRRRADGGRGGGRRPARGPPEGLRRLPQAADRLGRAAADGRGRRGATSTSPRRRSSRPSPPPRERRARSPGCSATADDAGALHAGRRAPARSRCPHVRRDRPRQGADRSRQADRP